MKLWRKFMKPPTKMYKVPFGDRWHVKVLMWNMSANYKGLEDMSDLHGVSTLLD
jgi:hypothetical protein